jgi:hypothetical protein
MPHHHHHHHHHHRHHHHSAGLEVAAERHRGKGLFAMLSPTNSEANEGAVKFLKIDSADIPTVNAPLPSSSHVCHWHSHDNSFR